MALCPAIVKQKDRAVLSDCPLRLTLLAGKDGTENPGFSSTLAYRENHTPSSFVCECRKLEYEGLDSMCFSWEVKQGIVSSH